MLLDIIGCVVAGRKFGKLAEQKGEPKQKWQVRGILAYELTGLVVGITLAAITQVGLVSIIGYGIGALVAAGVYSNLKSKPDRKAEQFEEFGTAPKDKNFEEPV